MPYDINKKQRGVFKRALEFIGFSNIVEVVGLLLLVFIIRTFGFGLYQVPSGSMETTMLVGERFFADKFTYLIRSPRRGEIISFNAPRTVFDYSSNKFMGLIEKYIWGPANVTKRVIGIPGDRVRGVLEDGKPVVYLNDVKLDEPYLNKYPLIFVWKQDPAQLQALVQRDIATLKSRGAAYEGLINTILEKRLAGQQEVRSYDPNYAFDAQPFYRIKSEWVERDGQGNIIMRKPATPMMGNGGKSLDEFSIVLGSDQYWVMGDNRLGSGDSRSFGPIEGDLIHGRIVFRIWSIDSDESWWIFDLIKHPIDFFSRMRFSRFFQCVC